MFSRQGEGTTFVIFIPLRHGESKFEKWISAPLAKVKGVEVQECEADRKIVNRDDTVSKNKDIALVVEDNEDIARYIGNIIKDSFSVVYARNGKEGIIKAEEYVPDIIITDIMMPEYDGLEMTRDIRKSNLLNHIPVIIVTAKGDDANKLHGLDSGADAYLIKPFSPDELKLRIRKLVEYRNMLREKYSQILTEGREIAKIHPNMVVKIPMTVEGLKACKVLSSEGIKTNVTLIFTSNQALLAARAGATYVSPFLGRLDDISVRGVDLVAEIAEIFRVAGIETQIIAASVRNTMHITDCALAGADIATVPYKVIEQMTHHPLTDAGIKKFQDDYRAVFGE